MQHSAGSTVQGKYRHEGPKNHILTFALSIVLTILSFLAVAYSLSEDTQVEKWFVGIFIMALAVFQAVMQLAFWMHLKDKGHGISTLFIALGCIVALTCIISAIFWCWW